MVLINNFRDSGSYYLTDQGWWITDWATLKAEADALFMVILPHVFFTRARGDKLWNIFSSTKFGESIIRINAAMIESVDDGVGTVLYWKAF
jgi:hypothetical protein